MVSPPLSKHLSDHRNNEVSNFQEIRRIRPVTDANTLSRREQTETDAANASGRQPVLFVHGLWLLASS